MTWYAFHGYPDIEVAGIQEKDLTALGFHGYATKAQADANPNTVSFFQIPALKVMEQDYKVAKASGQQPGGPNSNLANPKSIPGSIATATKNELFHGLVLNNWLLRIGEIILGIVLLGVGLAHITGQENLITNGLKAAGAMAVMPK